MAMIYIIPPIASPLDSATLAWIAAVQSAGGTVSAGRQTTVNNLIVGLKADGIFTKLDRLWLLAAENSKSALVDIIAVATATANNTPTFTIDRGYNGDGTASGQRITSDIAVSAGGINYALNSACILAWNNTLGTDASGLVGSFPQAEASMLIRLFPKFTDTNLYWDVNSNGTGNPGLAGQSGATGLYVMNRTASNAATLDLNGTQIDSQSTSSGTFTTQTLVALMADGSSASTVRQCSAFGFGGQLTAGDRTNINTRMRTYMTAVGVP